MLKVSISCFLFLEFIYLFNIWVESFFFVKLGILMGVGWRVVNKIVVEYVFKGYRRN